MSFWSCPSLTWIIFFVIYFVLCYIWPFDDIDLRKKGTPVYFLIFYNYYIWILCFIGWTSSKEFSINLKRWDGFSSSVIWLSRFVRQIQRTMYYRYDLVSDFRQPKRPKDKTKETTGFRITVRKSLQVVVNPKVNFKII